MLIRQHQAKIQIKKEKKKPGYEVSAVARVCSGTFFFNLMVKNSPLSTLRQSSAACTPSGIPIHPEEHEPGKSPV
jgi:hypothetical protein